MTSCIHVLTWYSLMGFRYRFYSRLPAGTCRGATTTDVPTAATTTATTSAATTARPCPHSSLLGFAVPVPGYTSDRTHRLAFVANDPSIASAEDCALACVRHTRRKPCLSIQWGDAAQKCSLYSKFIDDLPTAPVIKKLSQKDYSRYSRLPGGGCRSIVEPTTVAIQCSGHSGNGKYKHCREAGCMFDKTTKACSAAPSATPASTTESCSDYSGTRQACTRAGCFYTKATRTCACQNNPAKASWCAKKLAKTSARTRMCAKAWVAKRCPAACDICSK